MREGLSARLDGEPAVDGRLLDEHVDGCPDCSSWLATATVIGRRVRVAPVAAAAPTADAAFVAEVLARSLPVLAAGAVRRRRRERFTRNALAAAGAALLVLVLVSLVGAARYVPEAAHLTSTTAFWAAVLGAGFVLVSLSPARSTTAAPFLATSATFLVVATVFDLVGRHVHVLHEVPTTVAVAGMVAVVALAWPRREGSAG